MAAVQHELDKLRAIRPMHGGLSPVRIAPDGSVTLKCGSPECITYVPGEHLTRVKVMVQIPDDLSPVAGATKSIQVERELCPHCFVMNSKHGTQTYDPTPGTFGRSASKAQASMIWRNLRTDARPASVVDPEAYAQIARRYGR